MNKAAQDFPDWIRWELEQIQLCLNTPPAERPNRHDMFRWSSVYLMRGNDGLHKIGYSFDPENRRFQIIYPGGTPPLVLVQYKTPFHRELENALHNHFKNSRSWGEWFHLTAEDAAGFWDTAAALEVTVLRVEVERLKRVMDHWASRSS